MAVPVQDEQGDAANKREAGQHVLPTDRVSEDREREPGCALAKPTRARVAPGGCADTT